MDNPKILMEQNHIKRTATMQAIREAVAAMEGIVGEGVSGLPANGRNAYGRRAIVSPKGSLAFALGLAQAGVRASAWVNDQTFQKERQLFLDAVRRKTPLVVYVEQPDFEAAFPFLLPCGALAFSAGTPQEAQDIGLIAHWVSERALLPAAVLLCPRNAIPADSEALADEKMASWLGDPDALIESPTPAQQILFGPRRRRVPQWFNLDVPALLNPRKAGKAAADERAAGSRFFESHLEGLIAEGVQAFAAWTGRAYHPFTTQGEGKPERWLLADWSQAGPVQAGWSATPSAEKSKTGVLEIRQWAPFPSQALSTFLAKAAAVTVVEPPSLAQPLLLKAIQGWTAKNPLSWHSVKAALPLEAAQVALALKNMEKGGAQKSSMRFGTAFTKSRSASPRHEVLQQEIARAYPGIASEVAALPLDSAPGVNLAAPRLTWLARRYRDMGPPYSKLNRFYQDTALFYDQNALSEVLADPFQALPLVPAASAGLGHWARGRKEMPVFEASSCTACGACFAACPHAALPPLAIGMEALLKGGMEIAGRNGSPLSSLTPLIKNLAAGCSREVLEHPTAGLPEGLAPAFQTLANQMGLEGEKREKARADVHALAVVLADLPLAYGAPVFAEQEQQEPGTGVLFSVLSDPLACIGCGICAESCPEDALSMQPSDERLREGEEKRFRLWEQLPDTTPETMRTLEKGKWMDPLRTAMLPRASYAQVAGGQEADGDTLHKTALRTLAAILDSGRQDVVEKELHAVREVTDQLSARIHQSLSDALPKRAFEPLEQALGQAGEDKVPLDVLLGHIAEGEHLSRVDKQTLQRQMQLVKALQDLQWVVKEGPSGTGRARYSAAIALETAEWLGSYPWNHFSTPTLLLREEASFEETKGLLEGLYRHWMDNIRLLRRGRLEAGGKYRPHQHDPELASLEWKDLDAAERSFFPPFVVVASLNPLGISLLGRLAGEGLPIKGILLDTASPDDHLVLQQGVEPWYRVAAGMSIPALRSMLSVPQHASAPLREALLSSGPAFIHLFSPLQEGKKSEEAASLALKTRAFPLLAGRTGEAGCSLEGNPSPDTDWVSADITLPNGSTTYFYTYADWLCSLPAWSHAFRSWTPEAGSPLTVPLYLQAEGAGKKDKVPVVAREGLSPTGFEYWIPSEEVLQLTQTTLSHWNGLRRLADTHSAARRGKVEEQAAKDRAAAERASLYREFEERLAAEQSKWMGQVKERLREKLLALSKMRS